MATATTASPAQGEGGEYIDPRNLEWKADNIGSKLLEKMGWREGQAVGKRQREKGLTTTGQGLRAVQRREGLGLGATIVTAFNQDQPQHVGDFGQVLAALREQHGPPSVDGKKKSKKKRSSNKTGAAVLPTNKVTHTAVRQAKFQQKTADDLKCIFAGASFDFPKIAVGVDNQTTSSSKKRKGSGDKDRKKKEKRSKKDKKGTSD